MRCLVRIAVPWEYYTKALLAQGFRRSKWLEGEPKGPGLCTERVRADERLKRLDAASSTLSPPPATSPRAAAAPGLSVKSHGSRSSSTSRHRDLAGVSLAAPPASSPETYRLRTRQSAAVPAAMCRSP